MHGHHSNIDLIHVQCRCRLHHVEWTNYKPYILTGAKWFLYGASQCERRGNIMRETITCCLEHHENTNDVALALDSLLGKHPR